MIDRGRIAAAVLTTAALLGALTACTQHTVDDVATAPAATPRPTAAASRTFVVPPAAHGEVARLVLARPSGSTATTGAQETDVRGIDASDGYVVEFSCTASSPTHLLGWRLTTEGGELITAARTICDGTPEIDTAIIPGAARPTTAHLTITGDTASVRAAYAILTPGT
jgi:hypothetical protein